MKKIPYFLIAALILLADQLSKWFVSERIIRPAIDDMTFGATEYNYVPKNGFFEWLTTSLHEGGALLPYHEISILPFFNLVMVWNKGVSFGLFNQGTDHGVLILTGFSVLVTIGFSIWMFFTRSWVQALGISMVIGGAIGNVIDRVRFGAVIDFLDFHAMGWHYPAFNIADSAIVVGVIVLMIYTMFLEKRLSPAQPNL